MPETYGLPEPEPTRTERAQYLTSEAVAGQGVVRRVVLYTLVAGALVLTPAFWPCAVVGIVALILLQATDKGLS